MNIEAGQRYLYTGDLANAGCMGTVQRVYETNFGRFMDGRLDDGREQKQISVWMFMPQPGQRFKDEATLAFERASKMAYLQFLQMQNQSKGAAQ